MIEYIREACNFILMIFLPLTLWQVAIALFGLIKPKPMPKALEQLRFAVLICAKDEQAVIGNLVESLNRQQYDPDKFTVFVVADNCIDHTAQRAAEQGATVLERYDPLQKGKGYAMTWAIDTINAQYAGCFDAFAVFDADNLVDPQFLAETNNALQHGADVTQGYRDTKNPYDSTVSGCYSIYWLLLMRFFHCARYNAGLSCMVGGTGFAFKSYLVKNGFFSKTLTEDIEFSVHQILRGKKIVPVRSAIFYDEQPTEVKASIIQRFRWSAGNIQCAQYILPGLRKYSTRQPLSIREKISCLDMVLYMLATLTMPFAIIIGAISLSTSFTLDFDANLLVIQDSLVSLLLSFVVVMMLGVLTLVLEKKSVRKYAKAILFFPVFIIPFGLLSIVAIIPRQVEWTPIAHTCTTEITDMANIS